MTSRLKAKQETQQKRLELELKILQGCQNGLKKVIIPKKGRGVIADKPFAKGDYVITYEGNQISAKEAKKFEEEYAKNSKNLHSYMYYFEFKGKKLCIDAHKETSHLGRLINHDLEGNVVSKLHSINGQPYIVFFAKRDIKKGEEIAYDYNDQRKDVTENLLWWDPKKGKKKITNDTTFTKVNLSQDSKKQDRKTKDKISQVLLKAKIELEDIRKVRSNQGEVIVSSALSNFQEHELTSEDVGSIIQEEDKVEDITPVESDSSPKILSSTIKDFNKRKLKNFPKIQLSPIELHPDCAKKINLSEERKSYSEPKNTERPKTLLTRSVSKLQKQDIERGKKHKVVRKLNFEEIFSNPKSPEKSININEVKVSKTEQTTEKVVGKKNLEDQSPEAVIEDDFVSGDNIKLGFLRRFDVDSNLTGSKLFEGRSNSCAYLNQQNHWAELNVSSEKSDIEVIDQSTNSDQDRDCHDSNKFENSLNHESLISPNDSVQDDERVELNVPRGRTDIEVLDQSKNLDQNPEYDDSNMSDKLQKSESIAQSENLDQEDFNSNLSNTTQDDNKDDKTYEPPSSLLSDTEKEIAEDLKTQTGPDSVFKKPKVGKSKSNMVVKSTGIVGDKGKKESKRQCCLFCMELHTKLPRHWQCKHADKKEIQELMKLPEGKERNQFIAILRNKGNFLHNTDPAVKDNQLIVSRRMRTSVSHDPEDYISCPKCLVNILRKSLVVHKCMHKGDKVKGHTLVVQGIKLECRIHEVANEVLREDVSPFMENDEVTRTALHDKLIVMVGNHFEEKLQRHQHALIRQKMRDLGRLLIQLRERNEEIKSLSDLFRPKNFQTFVESVNSIAGFDVRTKEFKHPSVPQRYGGLLKQAVKIFKAHCAEEENYETKTRVEAFSDTFETKYWNRIFKLTNAQIAKQKRNKVEELPESEDVKILMTYLDEKRTEVYNKLQNEKDFSFENWKRLAELTVSSAQTYAKKRAGEADKIETDDLEACLKNIGKKLDELKPEENVIFEIRGKLTRTVSVILKIDIIKSMHLIYKLRIKAGVPKENPYLFGLPCEYTTEKHLMATDCMRKIAKECGAKRQELLRGTKLRKHFATQLINKNPTDNERLDFANYMGHARNTHDNFYRKLDHQKKLQQVGSILTEIQSGKLEGKSKKQSQPGENRTAECNKVSKKKNKAAETCVKATIQSECHTVNAVECEESYHVPTPFAQSQKKKTHTEPATKPSIPASSKISTDDGNASLTLKNIEIKKKGILQSKRPTRRPKPFILSSTSDDDDDSLLPSKNTNKRKKTLQSKQSTKKAKHLPDTSDLDSNLSESEEEMPKTLNTSIRKRWTKDEIQLLQNYFSDYLTPNSGYPSGKIMQDFLNKHNLSDDRTTSTVRSWIQYKKSKSSSHV